VACAAGYGAPLLLRGGSAATTRAYWLLTSPRSVSAADLEDVRVAPRAAQPFSPRRALRRVVLLLPAVVGGLCLLLLLVRLCSRDAAFPVFPAACPAHLPDGCARIAESAPHRTGTLQPLQLAVKRRDVAAAARAWAATSGGRSTLLADTLTPHGLLHFRFVSRFFGFADDVLLSLSCTPDAVVRVQAHSQLRLGRGDLGVNVARHAALWAALAAQLPTRAEDDDALWCTEETR
jgi:uncharacterized protein (DUF1499 family)